MPVGSKRPRPVASANDESDDSSDVGTAAPGGSRVASGSGGASATSSMNAPALRRCLAELSPEPPLPWLERLEVVSADAITLDASDDLKLELALSVPLTVSDATTMLVRGAATRLGCPPPPPSLPAYPATARRWPP